MDNSDTVAPSAEESDCLKLTTSNKSINFCMHMHWYTYVGLSVCMYVRTYVYMDVFMYVCMYVCACVLIVCMDFCIECMLTIFIQYIQEVLHEA